MKPKKIRVTKPIAKDLTSGKIYSVRYWDQGVPCVKSDSGLERIVFDPEWEPVSEFNHGDPVWAWDGFNEGGKFHAIYVFKNPVNDEHVVCYSSSATPVNKEFVKHRKPQMTLQELADKADVNLDKVEIVD